MFGSLFHKTALARFSSTLAMLMKAGVPILQAFDIVVDTVNNRVVGKAVEDVQRVRATGRVDREAAGSPPGLPAHGGADDRGG